MFIDENDVRNFVSCEIIHLCLFLTFSLDINDGEAETGPESTEVFVFAPPEGILVNIDRYLND